MIFKLYSRSFLSNDITILVFDFQGNDKLYLPYKKRPLYGYSFYISHDKLKKKLVHKAIVTKYTHRQRYTPTFFGPLSIPMFAGVESYFFTVSFER
jgi:hypothetical protein